MTFQERLMRDQRQKLESGPRVFVPYYLARNLRLNADNGKCLRCGCEFVAFMPASDASVRICPSCLQEAKGIKSAA